MKNGKITFGGIDGKQCLTVLWAQRIGVPEKICIAIHIVLYINGKERSLVVG